MRFCSAVIALSTVQCAVLKKTLKGYWAVGLDSFCYTVFIKFFGSYYLSRYSSNLEGSTMNANAPKNNCPVKSCPAFSLRWTDQCLNRGRVNWP